MEDYKKHMSHQIPKEKNITMGAPHLVLLGAGASKAAFPNGDANGKEVPLTKDLARVCKLGVIDPQAEKEKDFESYYSDITDTKIKSAMESRIFDYFSSLRLPTEPTIYDYLVLSLRKKDVIATFNWDPFLFQAGQRNHQIGTMPQVLYLHGSVAVGYCMKDKTMGMAGYPCSKCNKPFTRPDLLYPVKEKDYQKDEIIKTNWDYLQKVLKRAYIFTIFGYSAPETDVEAIDLLKRGWGDKAKRNLEEVEIINRPGTDKDKLREIWDEFIHTHHYGVIDDFFSSWLMKHPRRSCDAMWETLMMVRPYKETPPPMTNNLAELQNWFSDKLTKYE